MAFAASHAPACAQTKPGYEDILDLTLAGAVGGLNRLFYAQTRRTTASAAENRFHFVENGRPE